VVSTPNNLARVTCLLKELREAAGLSVADMAQNIRISPDRYDQFERGDPAVPVGVLYSISRCLGMDVTVLLSGSKFPMEATITCCSNGDIQFERREAEGGQAEQTGHERRENTEEELEIAAEIDAELKGKKTEGPVSRGDNASPYSKKEKEDDKVFRELHKRGLHAIPQKLIIEWQRAYATGIDFFDKQHKEFIELINQLYMANLVGWSYSQEVFKRIIRWALGHIQNLHNEETVMERVGYPTRKIHGREHVVFIKEVLAQARAMQKNQKVNVGAFVLFSRDWMQSHVGISDRDLGSYLIRLKRGGNLSGITMRVKRNADRPVIVR
jgi:hemerythrin-like metal-binding protein